MKDRQSSSKEKFLVKLNNAQLNHNCSFIVPIKHKHWNQYAFIPLRITDVSL